MGEIGYFWKSVDNQLPAEAGLVQHAINAIWRAVRTLKTVQLMKFITILKRRCFEMPNGTYSQR